MLTLARQASSIALQTRVERLIFSRSQSVRLCTTALSCPAVAEAEGRRSSVHLATLFAWVIRPLGGSPLSFSASRPTRVTVQRLTSPNPPSAACGLQSRRATPRYQGCSVWGCLSNRCRAICAWRNGNLSPSPRYTLPISDGECRTCRFQPRREVGGNAARPTGPRVSTLPGHSRQRQSSLCLLTPPGPGRLLCFARGRRLPAAPLGTAPRLLPSHF